MDLSVAIATWNRAKLLGQTLQSLADLRTPPGLQWQLLVCDNNSTDDTRTTVHAMANRLPLTYLHEPRQGKSFALNRLIQQSTGRWLLFLDDDVLVHPDWLGAYQGAIERYPDAACLGGPIHPWHGRPVTGRRAFLLNEYPAVFGAVHVEIDTPMQYPDAIAYGANMAVRRDALPAHGFDTRRGMVAGKRIAGEDVQLLKDLLDTGAKGWLLRDAAVKHWVPPNQIGLYRFCRWHMGIGRTWVLRRGRPTPGALGVPFWAWREFTRRLCRAVINVRLKPTRSFYDAAAEAAQYLGYLRGQESDSITPENHSSPPTPPAETAVADKTAEIEPAESHTQCPTVQHAGPANLD